MGSGKLTKAILLFLAVSLAAALFFYVYSNLFYYHVYVDGSGIAFIKFNKISGNARVTILKDNKIQTLVFKEKAEGSPK